MGHGDLRFRKSGIMIQHNELITLLITVGILVFIAANRSRIKQFPSPATFLVSFLLLFCGCVLTNLEEVFLEDILNHAEHFCYAASAVVLALWCRKVFTRPEEDG